MNKKEKQKKLEQAAEYIQKEIKSYGLEWSKCVYKANNRNYKEIRIEFKNISSKINLQTDLILFIPLEKCKRFVFDYSDYLDIIEKWNENYQGYEPLDKLEDIGYIRFIDKNNVKPSSLFNPAEYKENENEPIIWIIGLISLIFLILLALIK